LLVLGLFLKGAIDKKASELICLPFFHFLTVFNEPFSKRFFRAGGLNRMFKSELTLLHQGAVVGELGKMKVPLYCKSLFFELET
jgi:hypothetical protein